MCCPQVFVLCCFGMPFILDSAKFGLMWVFLTLRGRAVAMLVAPSLPPPSAGGEVLWALWRAETDLPYSVIDGFAAMFDATPSCGLCSGFAHPGRSPPCFQFPLLAATLDSVFKIVGFLVLAPVSVVFSVDVHSTGAGKAKEGKCQKLKPSFEDYDLCEVRFADSAPQVWLLGRQLGSSIVNFFSAVAQVAAAAAAHLDGQEPFSVFFLVFFGYCWYVGDASVVAWGCSKFDLGACCDCGSGFCSVVCVCCSPRADDCSSWRDGLS